MNVYVCITGDLFHYGHINFFNAALQFGKHLYVGVCSDEDVANYKRLPILNLQQRVAIISTCSLVKRVIPGAPPCTTKEIIEAHSIDTVVASKSYSSATLNKYYDYPQKQGILRIVPYTESISTTKIIKKCYDYYSDQDGVLGELS